MNDVEKILEKALAQSKKAHAAANCLKPTSDEQSETIYAIVDLRKYIEAAINALEERERSAACLDKIEKAANAETMTQIRIQEKIDAKIMYEARIKDKSDKMKRKSIVAIRAILDALE